MTASTAILELRRIGAELSIVGDRFRCIAPRGALTDDLRLALSVRKAELIALLTAGASGTGYVARSSNSPACHLYLALNQPVDTPVGCGWLWQVFSHRVGVVLDAEPKRVAFFRPDQVQPMATFVGGSQAHDAALNSEPT
jgi:hypothetical protein